MKSTALLFAFLVITLFGCADQQQPATSAIEKEVRALKENAQKQAFLENIYETDQHFRLRSKDIVQKHGYGSPEDQENNRSMMDMDQYNLAKVEHYLALYDYPDPETFSNEATLAPWLVVHHCTDVNVRNRHFPTLHGAYLQEKIDENAFALYLDRTYRKVYGESFEMRSPYRMENRIDSLIQLLDLPKNKTSL